MKRTRDDPQIRLTPIGEIVEKYLLSSENIPGVKIDRYVIMPDHIHAIIFLDPDKYVLRQGGSSRAPTPTNEMLPHIVSTFKRFCNKEIGNNIFQRGYIEHIIRDREDYEEHLRYIRDNPAFKVFQDALSGAGDWKENIGEFLNQKISESQNQIQPDDDVENE